MAVKIHLNLNSSNTRVHMCLMEIAGA